MNVTVLINYARLTSIYYILCKNIYVSCVFVLLIYDLLISGIIIDIAYVDAKGYLDLSSRIYDLVIVMLKSTLPNLPTLLQGAETWFQHPPILLRVRLWPTQAGHC